MPSIPSLVQRLLRRLRRATPPPPPHAVEDIPKYPPFLRGLPAFHPDLLLQTQEPLVRRLQDQLKLTDAQFTTYILPCLRNYAAYVHLLPASQNHHHRGAGGLLRHGLEVAERAAAIAAEKAFFTADTVPAVKRAVVVEWQAASALAGLCHDLGKPIADVEIGSEDGTQNWDPFDPQARSIFDWCQRHQLDRYFLRWRKNRHQWHETEGILVVPRILTEATLSWIGRTDPRVRMQLTQSIARGTDAPGANLIAPIVTEADAYSVRADLRKWSSTTGVEMLAIPSQRYILDAMREMIQTSKWPINQAGGRVFVTAHGALLPWPGPDAAGMDVVNYLRKNEIPGISRDPDNLADILIDTGIAVPLKLPHGDMRYWRARITLPEGRDLELTCLRVPDKNYLIDHHTPPLVAVLCDVPDEAAALDAAEADPLEDDPEAGGLPAPVSVTTPGVAPPAAVATPGATPVTTPATPPAPDAGQAPAMVPAMVPAPGGATRPPTQRATPAAPVAVTPQAPPAIPNPFRRQLQAAFPHVGNITPEAATTFLHQRGAVGATLLALARQAAASATCPAWLDPPADGAIWLRYPAALEQNGSGPIPERAALAASALFTRNPTKVTSVLHDRAGHTLLRLENQVAFQWVAWVLGQPQPTAAPPVTVCPAAGAPPATPRGAAPGSQARTSKPPRPAAPVPDPSPPLPTGAAPTPAAVTAAGSADPAVPARPGPDPDPARPSGRHPTAPTPAVAPSDRRRELRDVTPAAAPPAAGIPAAEGTEPRGPRAPSPFRSPLAVEPAPAPDATPATASPADPFLDRLRTLAAQDHLCAGLTAGPDGFEIHSAHKETIAKHLELKPKALDYLLKRHGRPRADRDGIVYHLPLG